MPERVRVKDPVSGHEFTVWADHAESNGLTVLDKAAVDGFGRDLPPKHNVDKSGQPVQAASDEHQEG